MGGPADAQARVQGRAAREAANLTRLRVVAYVTRGCELLVFEHRDLPEAGTQVPAGRLDPGESLEECLARELDEEVGIRARGVGELAHVTRRQGDGNVYESHYFHLETTRLPTTSEPPASRSSSRSTTCGSRTRRPRSSATRSWAPPSGA